jgi:hypothetical protein
MNLIRIPLRRASGPEAREVAQRILDDHTASDERIQQHLQQAEQQHAALESKQQRG